MSFRTSFVLSWRLCIVFMISIAAYSPAPTAPPVTNEATEPATNSTTIDISTLTGRIVFDNSEDIYTVNVDGTDLKQLTNNPGPEFDPMWSPDGTRIVYRDSRRGVNHDDEIYVMNADGSEQTNLTQNPANDWGPAWSPDGRKIAFNSDRASGLPQLFVMNADGSEIQQLTTREAEYPTWSPDGTQIAVMSSEPDYEIYIIKVDGSGETRLTHSWGSDGWAVWSPDGKKIAFSSERDDCRYSQSDDCKRSGDIGPFHDIWIMNTDGTEPNRLTDIFGQFLAWSPDGRYIIFNSPGGVYVMNANGSAITQLSINGVAGELLFSDWIR